MLYIPTHKRTSSNKHLNLSNLSKGVTTIMQKLTQSPTTYTISAEALTNPVQFLVDLHGQGVDITKLGAYAGVGHISTVLKNVKTFANAGMTNPATIDSLLADAANRFAVWESVFQQGLAENKSAKMAARAAWEYVNALSNPTLSPVQPVQPASVPVQPASVPVQPATIPTPAQSAKYTPLVVNTSYETTNPIHLVVNVESVQGNGKIRVKIVTGVLPANVNAIVLMGGVYTIERLANSTSKVNLVFKGVDNARVMPAPKSTVQGMPARTTSIPQPSPMPIASTHTQPASVQPDDSPVTRAEFNAVADGVAAILAALNNR